MSPVVENVIDGGWFRLDHERRQVCGNKNARVRPRGARTGAGETNLHRNAVKALLRTRSLGGNLRHSRKQFPRSRFRFPTGFTLVRQKDRLVSNMAEVAPG
jgi:hypothetical protein